MTEVSKTNFDGLVEAIVSSVKVEMQLMIDKVQADLNERLTKIEQMLGQIVYADTTPALSLINSTLASKSNSSTSFKNQPQQLRRRTRRSKSVTKSDIPDLNEIPAVGVKELRKKDALLQDSNLITLHFLFKHKKVAVLTFPPETEIKDVKRRLNQDLLEKKSYTIEKLHLSIHRLGDQVDDPSKMYMEDKEDLTQFSGHQLIYCYGTNKQEQKRARTLTSAYTGRNITKSTPNNPKTNPEQLPPSLDIFAAKKKKRNSSIGQFLDPASAFSAQKKRGSPSSPLSQRRKKELSHSSPTREVRRIASPKSDVNITVVKPEITPQTDEFSALQQLVTDDCDSFDDYKLSDT